MWFTDAGEDIDLHKRLCPRLRPRGGLVNGKTAKDERRGAGVDENALPLAETRETVRILDFLSNARRPRRKGEPFECAKIAGRANAGWGRDFYLLRGACSPANQTPDGVRLLASLGVLDTFWDSAGWVGVVGSSRRLNCVLCVVVGRPRTREQDPQLVLRPLSATSGVRCLTRRSFTFCDVEAIWLARESILAKHAQEIAGGEGEYEMVWTRPASRAGPFSTPDDRERQKETGRRFAAEEVNQSLTEALAELGAQVKYGHIFSAITDFSYSKRIFTTNRGNSTGPSPSIKERLIACLKAPISPTLQPDEASDNDDINENDLFLHSENSSSYSSSEDDPNPTGDLVDMK
ncbi:unnamed protein product [Phytomonas sp. Hart1]|nr:unnamed protein product [Phytomonas sp. Hart1]|eukprot:CCW69766.1 unnamed protein product [Phytomonas sp. isolate Hart1]